MWLGSSLNGAVINVTACGSSGGFNLRLRSLVTVTANAIAISLLGLTAVALANEVTVGGLNVYGPIDLVSDLDEFVEFVSGGTYVTFTSTPLNGDYAVAALDQLQAFLSGLSSVSYSYGRDILNGALLALDPLSQYSDFDSSNYTIIVGLADDNPLLEAAEGIPEPAAISVIVSGIAGLAFLRRRFIGR